MVNQLNQKANSQYTSLLPLSLIEFPHSGMEQLRGSLIFNSISASNYEIAPRFIKTFSGIQLSFNCHSVVIQLSFNCHSIVIQSSLGFAVIQWYFSMVYGTRFPKAFGRVCGVRCADLRHLCRIPYDFRLTPDA